jgi:hypothetical protein
VHRLFKNIDTHVMVWKFYNLVLGTCKGLARKQ